MLPLDDSSENLSDMNKKLSEIIEEQTRQSEALAKSMVDIKNGIEVRPFFDNWSLRKRGSLWEKKVSSKTFFSKLSNFVIDHLKSGWLSSDRSGLFLRWLISKWHLSQINLFRIISLIFEVPVQMNPRILKWPWIFDTLLWWFLPWLNNNFWNFQTSIENAFDVFNELIQRTEIHLTKKLSRKLRANMKELKIRHDFGIKD